MLFKLADRRDPCFAVRMMTGTRADSRRTRRALLATALELFVARGHGGVSVAEIAAGAGAQPSQVNYHFGSKQGLFVEAACRGVLEVAQRVEEAGAVASSPQEYAEGIVRAAAEAPELLMFTEAVVIARHDAQLVERLGETLVRLHDQGEAAVRETLRRQGWELAASARVESEAYWSLMLGLGIEYVALPHERRRRLTDSAARLIGLIHRAHVAEPQPP